MDARCQERLVAFIRNGSLIAKEFHCVDQDQVKRMAVAFMVRKVAARVDGPDVVTPRVRSMGDIAGTAEGMRRSPSRG
jgi:hypothetical protein